MRDAAEATPAVRTGFVHLRRCGEAPRAGEIGIFVGQLDPQRPDVFGLDPAQHATRGYGRLLEIGGFRDLSGSDQRFERLDRRSQCGAIGEFFGFADEPCSDVIAEPWFQFLVCERSAVTVLESIGRL